jgi:hypothetical protein
MFIACRLNQFQAPQAGMPVPTYNDVVVNLDAEAAGNLDNSLRHFNVRARRRRVASGMIVHQPTRSPIAMI